MWVEKRGERRGGYPCIFTDRSGVKSSFHVSFCPGDCGEDGRGDLPFAAGYGVRRSWLSPSLAMERGAVSALDSTHYRALFFPFLLFCSSNPSRRHGRPPDAAIIGGATKHPEGGHGVPARRGMEHRWRGVEGQMVQGRDGSGGGGEE
jgi:hypothetical protein